LVGEKEDVKAALLVFEMADNWGDETVVWMVST
jgi:hypothetical protein